MGTRRTWGIALALLVPASMLAAPQSATAADISPVTADNARACSAVEAFWARGSGQDRGTATQVLRWSSQLNLRLTGRATPGHFEVGGQPNSTPSYPAVSVTPLKDRGLRNVAGAWMSSGQAMAYGRSVDTGVEELILRLTARAEKCPATLFVTGGFSQGAQVVGQAYNAMPADLRNRIVFNALFGDPKLYLPEGESGLFSATPCSKGERSPWRRAIANCDVDNGSLGARKPYLPSSHELTTGLWCAADDFVCGSSKKMWNTKGHNYSQEGGDIDAGVLEISRRIRDRLPPEPDAPGTPGGGGGSGGGPAQSDVDVTVLVPGTGTTGLDVAFVLDSTGSMSDGIEGAKQFASSMADTIEKLRGRVALIEYRDEGDEFVAETRSGLKSDTTEFRSKLAEVQADGGGDTPEAALTALMQAFNSLEWRPGATKAAVLITDAGFHEPDLATGVTLDEVVKRSLEIDPVNVYPVVPEYSAEEFPELTTIAERTSGRLLPYVDGRAEEALETTFENLENRPVVLLPVTGYRAAAGEEITFDTSESYAPAGRITEYAWDFDGDGVSDRTTTVPTTRYSYSSDGVRNFAVTVTDDKGRVASMSVPVTITSAPVPRDPELPVAASTFTASAGEPTEGKRNVALAWAPTGPAPWAWAVHQDGVELGLLHGDDTNATITDVDAETHTYTLAGVTEEGLMGDVVSAAVPRLSPPVAEDTTVTVTVPEVGTGRPTLGLKGPESAKVEVQIRKAKWSGKPKAWSTLAKATATGSFKGVKRAPGVTSCYRARVVGTSTWSTSACTAAPLSAKKLKGKQWKTTKTSTGVRVRTSSKPGSRLTLPRVRNGQVALSVWSCPKCGQITVSVAGKKVATVSTAGKKRRLRTILLRDRDFTRGTLALKHTGKRSPVSVRSVTVIRDVGR